MAKQRRRAVAEEPHRHSNNRVRSSVCSVQSARLRNAPIVVKQHATQAQIPRGEGCRVSWTERIRQDDQQPIGAGARRGLTSNKVAVDSVTGSQQQQQQQYDMVKENGMASCR